MNAYSGGLRRAARLVAGIAAAVWAVAGAAHAQVFNPETFTLANGMEVVLVENHRVPVVTHMVWYKAGAADEIPGASGAAHLLEHLMFKGTEAVPAGRFSEIVARHGGRDNAFTSHDYTGYFQSVAREHLALVMEMEADRMVNLRLEAEAIATERAVVLEERRSRTENSPASLLGEQMSAALYLNHPYGRPIIGWAHEVESLSADDLEAFYRHWYRPDNAILVVAGDITVDELKPLAERYYGALPAGPEARRTRPVEPPHRAARRVVLEDGRVRQAELRRFYLAPSYVAGASEHAYALEVLADLLGGRATSLLYRRLVVEDKVAVNAGTFYDPSNVDRAIFGIYLTPAAGVGLAELEQALDGLLAEVAANGADTAEVARSKRALTAQAVYARDSVMGAARVMGRALASGQSAADLEAWPRRIEAVTAAQVAAAARHVLDKARSVTGLLLPKDTGAAATSAVSRGDKAGVAVKDGN